MTLIAYLPVLILFAVVPLGFKYWRKRMALKSFEPLPAGAQPPEFWRDALPFLVSAGILAPG